MQESGSIDVCKYQNGLLEIPYEVNDLKISPPALISVPFYATLLVFMPK